MRTESIRHVPVVDRLGHLTGLVDDVQVLAAYRSGDRSARAGDIAFRCPVVATEQDSAVRVLASMLKTRQTGAVVVDDANRPLGIFTDIDGFALESLSPGPLPAVYEVMRTGPSLWVTPDTPAASALRLMCSHQVHHLLVRDGRDLQGVISIRDVVGRGSRPVGGLACSWTWRARPEARLDEAIAVMRTRGIGCLPVLDDGGRPVGTLTRTDVLRTLAKVLLESTVPAVSRQYSPRHRPPPAGSPDQPRREDSATHRAVSVAWSL